MTIRVRDIAHWLEHLAPTGLAADWDNVGLQVGGYEAPASTVLTCLSVSDPVIDQAISLGAQLIVAHHPVVLHPWKSVRSDQPRESLVARLITHSVSVYVAHTNLDVAPGGLGDWFAEAIGIQDGRPLVFSGRGRHLKLVVFVPLSHVEVVRAAICAAGAGHVGAYSHCTFVTTGTGTFLPLGGTHPYIGTEGNLEKVSEARLETVIPAELRQSVIEAMLAVHPYEEVAYDLYELVQPGSIGYGCVGQLAEPQPWDQFVAGICSQLQNDRVRVAGPTPRQVSTVAAVNGSGAEFMAEAKDSGADVLVTGDVRYHDAEMARMLGLCVIDVGHYASESMAGARLAEYLRKQSDLRSIACVVHVAQESDTLQTRCTLM